MTPEDNRLRRREFLQRTAMTAGVGAAAAATLSPDTLIAEAAAAQGRVKLPSARNMPIDTFVVVMMENRSFDHYLGWLPGADGVQGGLTYTDDEGKTEQTRPFAPDFQGCNYNDPSHGWSGGRRQLNGGKMDGFLKGDNDVFALSYYGKDDVPFLPKAVQSFTTYDRFFCSLLGPTQPNRRYMHAATSYGTKSNTVPIETAGLPDTTIFAALAARNVSNRYFYSDLPISAFWGAPGLARSSPVAEYYARCETGTLPALSFVDPAFANLTGGGTSGDEHPHGDLRTGQAWMADVVNAFVSSPQFRRGALFVVYDEWGGFFDHVRPPRVPDERANRNLEEDFGQMGFRIPTVAVSPYTRAGHVDHGTYGFESILKLIGHRFGVLPLTRRMRYARNIGRSFDWDGKPRMEPPALPDPPNVMSAACPGAPPSVVYRAPGAPPEPRPRAAHPAEELLTSGFLESLGFDFEPATPDRVFSHPDATQSAYRPRD